MKKIIFLIFSLLFMSSCWINNNNNTQAEQKSIIKRIDSLDFEKSIKSWEYTLIDIRTINELKQTWVIWEDVVNIDYYSPNFEEELMKLDKDKKYLIYCRSWNRSLSALWFMSELWFKNVLELEWWIWAWANSSKKFVLFENK